MKIKNFTVLSCQTGNSELESSKVKVSIRNEFYVEYSICSGFFNYILKSYKVRKVCLIFIEYDYSEINLMNRVPYDLPRSYAVDSESGEIIKGEEFRRIYRLVSLY